MRPNLKKLAAIADLVSRVPNEAWDFGTFGNSVQGYANGRCRTVACAIGHAAWAGMFQSAAIYGPRELGDPPSLVCNFPGIARELGLSDAQFTSLFFHSGYRYSAWLPITQARVARSIRQFIRRHKK